ncbi:MAG TPA: FAD-binding oxidoreductase [Thermoleophilaceae bacterium]|jgi:glycolate oxidase FAD binding subunit
MYDAVAAALREASQNARRVRVRGGGTKLGWGAAAPAPDVEIDMREHDRILEHNAGDLTAVVQAGVPLARLQDELAAHGQMLAIDPPRSDAATLGGTIATGDSGPLRHRYGAPRDLVLGMTVALSDGTIARTGGKVIKNVAGYDLAKLFTGSFGTLGAILDVSLRLHPVPPTATAVGAAGDPGRVAAAATALAHSAIEAQCLDVRWGRGDGHVLVRVAGGEAPAQAAEAARLLAGTGLETTVEEDDAALWEDQRAWQRSADGVVARVSGVQDQLADQMRVAERLGGSLVARAAHGLAWVTLPDAGAVDALRRELTPSPCVVLDGDVADPWGVANSGAIELMRRVKQRFDPAGACSPGVFVGGI